MEEFEETQKYWKRQKILARATGALEVLSGAGMIAGAYAGHKELGDVASIILASGGALVIADGVADIVSGRMASLLEKMSNVMYNYHLKKEVKNKTQTNQY